MSQERSSGILLHPTSLPGRYGIGDLGPSAYRFVDFLERSGQTFWQMLPLGPTGYGDSPYQTLSAFGGNPMLISPELLVEENLLDPEEIEPEGFDQTHVAYDQVIPYKLKLLKKAYLHFKLLPDHLLREPFHDFCKQEASWLEDFVLFFALKSYHNDRPWTEWPKKLRMRDPKALSDHAEKLHDQLQWYRFIQFLFFRQFEKLHHYAQKHHVKLIGDIPIFIAHDSSDVWSYQEWFKLDSDGNPTVVAGVPPDYFSKTGQRWGNPLFDWKVLKKEKYRFWVDRFSHMMKMFDLVRIDHFRGFASYWEIPAEETTAILGKWQKGPGIDLFRTLEKEMGCKLPVIAEDLGIITQDVTDLLDAVNYPGMAVLQFGFESMQSDDPTAFLPHNLKTNQVVYTGTHDNDTVVGWWSKQPEEVQDFIRRYLNTDARLIHRDMIRAAFGTVCSIALFPMQDLLGLGSESYMNLPGTTGGNWQWRMQPNALNTQIEEDLTGMTRLYGRVGDREVKSGFEISTGTMINPVSPEESMIQTLKKRRVLFAASEVYPFAKSGGLADVAASLPKALAKEFDISVILPFYGSIDVEKYHIVPLDLSYTINMNQKNYEASLYGCSHEGLTYYFVKSPCISEKEYFYGPPDQGYKDNAQRFTLFCRVIVELLKEDQAYSILHLNDWQTALAALLVKEDENLQVKTVYTIHNLAYQGIFNQGTLQEIGLSEHYFHMNALEFYGNISLMKAGIAYADSITTVSSEYAKEIQTETFGCGLDGFLRHHRHKLQGILNGIDTEVFSPETDPLLVQHYSSENWKKKRENKKAYLKDSGLKGINKPLFIFIGRFTWQKGIDLLIEILDKTADLNINIAILGEGETGYHQKLAKIASQYKHIHLYFGYKEELSHQMYAAADFLLMPSIFEPCGLNQMIAMRYGTLPIVHSVGGLKESVHPLEEFDPKSKKGFGISFDESGVEALLQAIKTAEDLYETSHYKKVSKHNMNCDFSWSSSAEKYAKLYHSLEQ